MKMTTIIDPNSIAGRIGFLWFNLKQIHMNNLYTLDKAKMINLQINGNKGSIIANKSTTNK